MKLNLLKLVRNFRPARTWMLLGIAITVGGAAAYAAHSYLNTQMQEMEARNKGEVTVVAVAKSDLQAGTKLDNRNVAARSIPAEFSHSAAVRPSDFARANGQTLAYPVKAGEMILWGLLEKQTPPTFSARVDRGRRAMTVPVDEINSISGMLEPGDLIDLIVTIDQNGKKAVFPLLQQMVVMATGQRSVDDAPNGEARRYSTVTLNTTPDQAQDLIAAREVGKLTALLRNPQDNQPIASGGKRFSALYGSRPSGAPSRPAAHGVPVMYGGAGATWSADALRLKKNPLIAPSAMPVLEMNKQ